MTQSRLGSMVEACINVLIGFWINFFMNLAVLPLFGFHISIADNFIIGIIYTGVSIARSYCIRRWFNASIHRAAERIAKG